MFCSSFVVMMRGLLLFHLFLFSGDKIEKKHRKSKKIMLQCFSFHFFVVPLRRKFPNCAREDISLRPLKIINPPLIHSREREI